MSPSGPRTTWTQPSVRSPSAPRPGFPLRGCCAARWTPAELADAAAERAAELGQLAGPEDDERDHQDDDQLRHADGTEHVCDSRGPKGASCIIGSGACRVKDGRVHDGSNSLPLQRLSGTMESMRPVRFALVIASVLVVSAIAGGLFGRGTASSQERQPDRYRAFTTALRLIETDYVEKMESDRLVYSAISGMLQTLDPHSSFLDPRTYAQMRERQEGRYYGLGITIQVDRRRHHGGEPVRRVAGLQEGRAPRRRDRARSTARTPRAGPASRRRGGCAGPRARRSRSRSGAGAMTS